MFHRDIFMMRTHRIGYDGVLPKLTGQFVAQQRVRSFYQAYVDGKFRKAYDIVADDSKDAFLTATKPHYDGFEIHTDDPQETLGGLLRIATELGLELSNLQVRGGSGRIAIGFHEHKMRRIIRLLHDVEPRDTRFLPAGAGVDERGGFESFDAFRFHLNLHMNDEHDREIGQTGPKLKRRLQF